MSRAAPTPVPWRALAGLVIADAPVSSVVAQTYLPQSLARWLDNPAERDTNTRMIEAAPDMAAALRDVAALERTAILHHRDLDKNGSLKLAQQALESAEAALRKVPS